MEYKWSKIWLTLCHPVAAAANSSKTFSDPKMKIFTTKNENISDPKMKEQIFTTISSSRYQLNEF